MSLIEGILKECVVVDFDADIHPGMELNEDGNQVAIVGFELYSDYTLGLIVDRMRKELGFKPLEPIDDEDYDECCDQDGEYYFFVNLTDAEPSKVEPSIAAMLVNSESPDNEDIYEIELTEEEQKAVYKCLDKQCREELGKSCEDLLAEAREELNESV